MRNPFRRRKAPAQCRCAEHPCCPGCGERLNVIEVLRLCDPEPRFIEVQPCTACGEGVDRG